MSDNVCEQVKELHCLPRLCADKLCASCPVYQLKHRINDYPMVNHDCTFIYNDVEYIIVFINVKHCSFQTISQVYTLVHHEFMIGEQVEFIPDGYVEGLLLPGMIVPGKIIKAVDLWKKNHGQKKS